MYRKCVHVFLLLQIHLTLSPGTVSGHTKSGCQNPFIKQSVIPADGGLRGGKLLRESTSVLGDYRRGDSLSRL